MSSSQESSNAASPMRQVLATAASTRQPSRMRQEGSRSSAVTPFSTTRMGSTVNATICESDNIKVAVRVRPLFPDKIDSRDTVPVLQVTEDHSTVKVVVPGPAGNKMQRDFQFHACLGPDVSQTDVMSLCGIPQLLDAALSGYNVTIFAYGQTGSGKTYTMSGREEVIGLDDYQGDTTDGIITRSVHYLYQQIKDRKDCKVSLSASYLEIYNEAVFDLLTARMPAGQVTGGLVGGRPALASKDLGIKWDPAQGFFVPGLKVVSCKTMDSMMEVIRLGMKHRHVGSHQLNMESSRSHSLMTIHTSVVSTDQSAWDYGTPRFGKICFVDLAGSERLKDSKSEGTMLKETTNINKSLFVLGKVISALAERDTAGVSTAHIPYRDSKLTKLLMDSLGGSALALMIACCSPSLHHVEETLSTLSYATRAKNIQNRPTVQYDPKEAQITALRREIELLRQENHYLREQIRLNGGASSIPATPSGLAAPGLDNASSATLSEPLPSHFSPRIGPGRPEWPSLRTRESASSPVPPGITGNASTHTSQSSFTGMGLNQWDSQGDYQDTPLPGFSNAQGSEGGAGGGILRHGSGMDAARGRLQVRLSQQQPTATQRRGSQLQDGSVDEAGVDEGGVDDSGSFALGQLRVGSGSAWRGGLSTPNPDDLAKRLADTQNLLAKFSAENDRLAKENDRLRVNRNILGSEHASVLDEIDALRNQLSGLETALLAGNASPSAAKALLTTLRGSSSAASPSYADMPTSSHPPSRDLFHTNSYNRSASSPFSRQPSRHTALSGPPEADQQAGTSGHLANTSAFTHQVPTHSIPDERSQQSMYAQPHTHGPPGAPTIVLLPPTDAQSRNSSYTRPPSGQAASLGDSSPHLGSDGSGLIPTATTSHAQGSSTNTATTTGRANSTCSTPAGSAVSASRHSKQPSYGDGKVYTPKAEGSMIVANQAGLALLLGDGPGPAQPSLMGPAVQAPGAGYPMQGPGMPYPVQGLPGFTSGFQGPGTPGQLSPGVQGVGQGPGGPVYLGGAGVPGKGAAVAGAGLLAGRDAWGQPIMIPATQSPWQQQQGS